jgi:hypothetical protein
MVQALPVFRGFTMSDQLTSWVRTVVPGLWAALVAWLISLGLPDSFTSTVSGLGNAVVMPVVLAALYAALRGLEHKMPPWLTVLLLGSNRPPAYADAPVAAAPVAPAPAGLVSAEPVAS